MNVRMDGTSLRFKITETELEMLLGGEAVIHQLTVSGVAMTLLIDPKPALPKGMCAQYLTEKESIVLRLLVATEKLAQLKAMGKSRDGIAVANDGVNLQLLVDVRKPRLG